MPTGKTRIGNWQEEQAFVAAKRKALDEARNGGQMLSQQIVAKIRQHNQECDLAPAEADGLLRFNVPIMIQNGATDGFLSLDIHDRVEGPHGWRVIPTTVPQKKPVLRSAFVFVPIPSADDAFFADQGQGDVVHYGQKVAIQTHPGLLEEPMFLMSERKTPDSQSKVSGNQAVYFTEEPGQAGLWSILYGNPEYREEMVGQPVKANSLILIQHTPTNTPLASTKAKLVNDFGPEFEVCANRYQAFHSKSASAPEEKAVFWAAVTAPPL